MKKFMYLFVAVLAFSSCGSDDDTEVSVDAIVGNYTLTNLSVNGQNQTLTECEKQETYSFKADGTTSNVEYELDSNNSCEITETKAGTWVVSGNDYAITAPGLTNGRAVTNLLNQSVNVSGDFTTTNGTTSVVATFTKN